MVEPMKKDTVSWDGLQLHPTVNKSPGGIPCKRGSSVARARIGGEQSRLQEYLESVANSENKPPPLVKMTECITKTFGQFKCEDSSAGDIIAIRKATRDTENLEIIEKRRGLGECLNVYAFRMTAGTLEGVSGFLVTIRTRATKNESTRGKHTNFP
jgi:hypothetical protein